MYPFLPRRLPERPPNLVADRRVATAQLQRPWQIGDTHASERHWITARCLRSGSPTFPIRLRSLLANVRAHARARAMLARGVTLLARRGGARCEVRASPRVA